MKPWLDWRTPVIATCITIIILTIILFVFFHYYQLPMQVWSETKNVTYLLGGP